MSRELRQQIFNRLQEYVQANCRFNSFCFLAAPAGIPPRPWIILESEVRNDKGTSGNRETIKENIFRWRGYAQDIILNNQLVHRIEVIEEIEECVNEFFIKLEGMEQTDNLKNNQVETTLAMRGAVFMQRSHGERSTRYI